MTIAYVRFVLHCRAWSGTDTHLYPPLSATYCHVLHWYNLPSVGLQNTVHTLCQCVSGTFRVRHSYNTYRLTRTDSLSCSMFVYSLWAVSSEEGRCLSLINFKVAHQSPPSPPLCIWRTFCVVLCFHCGAFAPIQCLPRNEKFISRCTHPPPPPLGNAGNLRPVHDCEPFQIPMGMHEFVWIVDFNGF